MSVIVAAILTGSIAYYYSLSSPRQPPDRSDDMPTTNGLEDKFGIKMLFSTRASGREWFMNMGYPNADDVFELRDQIIKRMDDGYWYAEGRAPDYQTRIMVESPSGTALWKNVEMTGYFRVMKIFTNADNNASKSDAIAESDYAIQAYARGGIHSNQPMNGSDGKEKYLNCVGSAYKGKFYFKGDASVAKEIGHPVYGPERFKERDDVFGKNSTSWTTVGKGLFPPLVGNFGDGVDHPGRWIGLKVVIYDLLENNQEYARIQTYIDDNADDGGRLTPSNDWKLLGDVVDKGDWIADPKPKVSSTSVNSTTIPDNVVNTLDELIVRCGNPFPTREDYSHMIITWFGHPDFISDPIYRPITNTASFRWDYSGTEFAYLSVREIGGLR
jgi:hypothetical protein